VTSDADRQLLLQIARDAILAHITRQLIAEPAITGALAVRAGAFVSLHAHGELRGCIGHVEPDELLGKVVPRCAIAAASEDPRFPAVTVEEMRAIEIELSLLGPLEPIAAPGEIEIGRHGLVVAQGWHRGLLLPQVAIEWQWDAETLAAHACHKAGLPRDAWRRGAQLWRFEAEVFAESHTDAI
jgi:AmmeMemoRadiSam system protein A